MRSSMIMACLGIYVALLGPGQAEEVVTVEFLLKQDFAVVSTTWSPAGAGLFLQKKNQLFMCLLAETPQSATVTTRYCKPVQ